MNVVYRFKYGDTAYLPSGHPVKVLAAVTQTETAHYTVQLFNKKFKVRDDELLAYSPIPANARLDLANALAQISILEE